jgi:hypothetical protein
VPPWIEMIMLTIQGPLSLIILSESGRTFSILCQPL